jgi:hypothetical protein
VELLIPFAFVVGFFVLKNREQRQRIALLGDVLSRFELEKLMQLHADALAAAMAVPLEASPKDRAFTITAELMLMQHTCH